MNKYLTKAIASMAIVTLAGCTADDLATDVMQKNRASNPYKIPLKTALARAEQYSDALSGVRLRSGKSVKSVSVKGIDVQMRSGEPLDTAFYLVNYNDGGFALLGADSRLEDLYAISDEGSLEWNDGESNPALQFYFDCIEEDARQRTASTNGIYVPGGGFPEPITPPIGRRMHTKCSPRLNKNVAGMSDRQAYRSYTDHNNRVVYTEHISQESLVAAALHAYHKSVKSVDGYLMEWNQVENRGVSNGLCYALRKMSISPYPNDPPDDGSTANTGSIPAGEHYKILITHNNNGINDSIEYNNDIHNYYITGLRSFNVDVAIDSLGRTNQYHDPKIPEYVYRDTIPGNPVVMYGQTLPTSSGSSRVIHHSWLLDGYIVYYTPSEQYNENSSPSYYYDKYLHCRWFAGITKNDGYFKWTNVNKFYGHPSEYDSSDKGTYDREYDISSTLMMSFARPK